jgi:hypothetical protein
VLTFFKPQSQVQASDAATILICDRCIESCHQVLASKREYKVDLAEKQQFRDWLHESVIETLIRAIVEMKHRDTLVAAFTERARLAAIKPDEAPQPDALKMLPGDFVRENRIVPWRLEENHLVVGFYNPLVLLDVYDEIVNRSGLPIRPALVSRDRINEVIERDLAGVGER